MRLLLFIWLILSPFISFSQDLKHWFPEEFGESVIPQNKIALVIGNSDYNQDLLDLKNPKNDALLIKETLESIDFEIIYKNDLTKKQFLDQLKKIKESQSTYDFILIYYAGHAIQDDNGNSYIIPIDFDTNSEFSESAVSISDILKYIESFENKSLVILDACRDNGNVGLPKPPINDPINTKLAYSTSFGKTASDNEDLNNTIYTEWLSKLLIVDNLSVYDILHNTSKIVLKKTNQNQYPTHYFGVNVDDIKFK